MSSSPFLSIRIFPVSRLNLDFPPSTTDVACTEFSGRALCRVTIALICSAPKCVIFHDGVTTSMEFERARMLGIADGFRRSLVYLYPSAHGHSKRVTGDGEKFLNPPNHADILRLHPTAPPTTPSTVRLQSSKCLRAFRKKSSGIEATFTN